MKSTKKALLLSMMSMLLCVAMLMGTTFAWFTDSVTSGANKIVAGNLDIEVEYSKNGTTWANLQDSPSLFTGALWEPGHTEVVYLRVKNAGTLALKYDLKVSPISETGGINQAGNSFKLSDHLRFATVSADTLTTYTRDAARAAVGAGVALNSGLRQSGEMQPKAPGATDLPTKYVTLVVYMPETVGNEANYKTGTTAPEINLGITVLATQLSSESDSFGNTYDGGLTNDISVVYNYFPQVNVTAQLVIDAQNKVAKGSEAGNNVTVTPLTDDNTKSKVEMSSTEQIENTPAAKLETILQKADGDQQTGSMTLKVVKDDTANANFKTDSNKINTATQDSTTYEVKVETEGVVAVPESDNKAKFKVDLFIGQSRTNVKMYHSGAPMAENASGANNTFTYNASTGYVTMYVDEFSPFTAVYDMPVAAIGTAVYYSLADAITAAQNNDVIILLSDTKENVTIPAEMTLTLNLNGKTLNGGNQTTAYEKAAITNNGTLTVTGNGTIKREDTGASAYYVIKNPTGTLTFDESFTGTVTNGSGLTTSHAGASVIVNGSESIGATLNIKNGNFQQTNFNVIKSEECSTIDISGGTISSDLDYAVLSYDNLTISGGTINGSVCTRSYGGFDALTTISGGTVGKVISAKYNSSATYAPVVNISGGNVTTVTTDDPQNANSVDGTISITGGTYSNDPSDYIAKGYMVVHDGTVWKVQTKAPVASWNGNNYFSVADARDAAIASYAEAYWQYMKGEGDWTEKYNAYNSFQESFDERIILLSSTEENVELHSSYKAIDYMTEEHKSTAADYWSIDPPFQLDLNGKTLTGNVTLKGDNSLKNGIVVGDVIAAVSGANSEICTVDGCNIQGSFIIPNGSSNEATYLLNSTVATMNIENRLFSSGSKGVLTVEDCTIGTITIGSETAPVKPYEYYGIGSRVRFVSGTFGPITFIAGNGNEIQVSGGTFDTDITSWQYGNVIVKQEGGKWIAEKQNVAEFNSVQYKDINDAIDAALASGSSATVKILNSCDIAKTVELRNFALTLDLNGKTVTVPSDNPSEAFDLIGGATLTINDSVGSGKLFDEQANGIPIGVYNGTNSIVINGGTIQSDQSNAIEVYDYSWYFNYGDNTTMANITVNGGTLKAESSALQLSSGANVITLNGGVIESTTTYAIYFGSSSSGSQLTVKSAAEIKSVSAWNYALYDSSDNGITVYYEGTTAPIHNENSKSTYSQLQ